jgi:hypothetical protein
MEKGTATIMPNSNGKQPTGSVTKWQIQEAASGTSVTVWTVTSTSTNSRTSKVAKAKIDLCKKVFCTRRELGQNLSEKYYNSTMKALNMGGLLLLRPKFFEWGQQTMQLIRASLNDRIINKLGDEAQKKAYDFVVENQQLPKQFMHAVRAELGNSFDDDTIAKVHNELLDFAFHGRSEVEWKKYRAATTDRSVGKEKKLQLREKLKAAGCSS